MVKLAAVKMNENAAKDVQRKEQKFSKEQILSSKKYRDRKDLTNALLTDGGMYTFTDVDERIDRYLKGKVK